MFPGLMLASAFLPTPPAAVVAPGEWPMWRHDRHVTGVSEGRGRMEAPPELLARHYLGALPQRLAGNDELDAAWTADFDGDGRLERISNFHPLTIVDAGSGKELWRDSASGASFNPEQVKIGRLLPGSRGLQVTAWDFRWQGGDGWGYLFSFEAGVRSGQMVWKTERFEGCHAPQVVAGDFDGDGKGEIAVAPHYRVLVVDATNGRMKYEVRWDVGRNYGYFSAADVDGDGCDDFIILADYTSHVAVIQGGASQGRLLWMKQFEGIGTRRTFLMRPLAESVTDLDGDGRVDLVLNLFNETGDNAWHTVIMDPANGCSVADHPGQYLWGVKEISPGAPRALFVSERQTLASPQFAPLFIDQWDGKKLFHRFTLPRGRFVLTTVAFDRMTSSAAQHGNESVLYRDVDGDGQREFLILEDLDGDLHADRLTAWGWDTDGRMRSRWSFRREGGSLEVVAVAGQGASTRVSVRDRNDPMLLTLDREGKEVSRREDRPGGFAPIPIVADLAGDGRNEVLVPTGNGDLLCLEWTNARGEEPGKPDAEAKRFEVKWKRRGMGMTVDPCYSLHQKSVQADDLDGDGKREIIARDVTQEEREALVVLNHDGSVRWRHVFDPIIAGTIDAGVDRWTTGYFTGKKTKDVYVSFHTLARSSLSSAVLDGKTGKMIWSRDSVKISETEWVYVGGWLPAVLDVNGDGREELLQCSAYLYTLLDGKTGELLSPYQLMTAKGALNGFYAYYGYPQVMDFDGDGRPEVFLNGAHVSEKDAKGGFLSGGGIAMLTPEGKPHTLLRIIDSEDPQRSVSQGSNLSAVADIDNDGLPEIGLAPPGGLFYCYAFDRGKTGSAALRRKWQLPIPDARTSEMVLADLNGDGVKEYLFAIGDTLYALGASVSRTRDAALAPSALEDGGAFAPRELWRLKLAAPASDPIVADVNGDGLLEILVCTQDGYLNVLGTR